MITQRIVFFALLLFYLCVVVKERADSSQQGFDALQICPGKIVCHKQVVGVTGFEPVTLRLSSACSNQLSYTPARCWWS